MNTERKRRKPFTESGIRRVPCSRCGAPSVHQWSICADGNQFRAACTRCDVALNALVLRFMRIPNAAEKMGAYRRRRGLA